MTEGQAAPSPESGRRDLPMAEVHRHFGLSWVWLLPLLALGLVAYLAYSLLAKRGPMISITFQTADGLSENQTQVRYKAVTLGTVEEIELSDDLSHVVAKVRMTDRAEPLLTEDTRFWVVRPRLNGGLAAFRTGLETLVSGAYVAIDPGLPKGSPRRHFKGLEKPPSVRSDEPGTAYFLEAKSLDGVGIGAPIFYRDLDVGEVLSYEFGEDSEDFKLRVFIRAPYDQRVVDKTRFWNASGLTVTTGAEGLHLRIGSLRSLFSGGIGFSSPQNGRAGPPSPPESTFRLHPNRALAEVASSTRSLSCVSYFQSSVSGLEEGSEVQMFGKRLGSVTEIELARDPRPDREDEIAVRVAYSLDPNLALRENAQELMRRDGMSSLVRDRLRVVLKSESLITGQKVLSLEYVAGAPPASLGYEGKALVLPSETQNFEALTESLSEIAAQINRIPFAEIGANLNRSLASIESTLTSPELQRALVSLDATLKEVRALAKEAKFGLRPALQRLPRIAEKLENAVDRAHTAFGQSGYGSDSKVQRNLERMLDQIADAARSIRLLADYLNRHPEALVSGRKENKP